MKITVSLLLLVAISHAEEFSRRNQEEDGNEIMKRKLLEGNFGLRVQPSIYETGIHTSAPRSEFEDNNQLSQNETPQREYGSPQEQGQPQEPISKISDVLTGQGPSFSEAIASHLSSPVSAYQSKLGSPRAYEVSQPVPSQLQYAEHVIYRELGQNQDNLRNLQPPNQGQSVQLPGQLNSFNIFGQFQPPSVAPPILSNQFLPRLDSTQNEFSQQTIQQVFPHPDILPQDIFQQIIQLGDQIAYEKTIQLTQNNENNERYNKGDSEIYEQKKLGIQYANQLRDQNKNNQEQIKISEEQTSTEQNTISQPAAVSYASFSQSLPTTQTEISSQRVIQSLTSKQSLPLLQQLPQPEAPPLFRPLQTPLQTTQQLISTTPAPLSTLFTVANQTPRRIGIVKIRQKLTTTQPHYQQSASTLQSQASSTTPVISTFNSQTPSTLQVFSTTRFTTPSSTTLKPSTVSPRSTSKSQSSYTTKITSRPTLPPLPPLPRRPLTTLQPLSSIQTTSAPQLVLTQSLPTLPSQPVFQTIPTQPPQAAQAQVVQTLPTLAPMLVLQPQQIVSLPTQQTLIPTLQPQPQLPTLVPIPVGPSAPEKILYEQQTPDNRPILQQYQIQSDQPLVQIQQYQSSPQQQLIPQPLVSQDQSHPIQQQLQNIQQQLEQIQQQPQFILPQQPQLIQQSPQLQRIQQQESQLQQSAAIQQQSESVQKQAQQQSQSQSSKHTQSAIQQKGDNSVKEESQNSISQEANYVHDYLSRLLQNLVYSEEQELHILPQLNPEIQQQLQLIEQPQLVSQQPQLLQQPQFIQQKPQWNQQLSQHQTAQATIQQQFESVHQQAQESQSQSSQQTQSADKQKDEKPNKKESDNSISHEGGYQHDLISHLLQNPVYSEEHELHIQPHLYPVPVGFPSIHSTHTFPPVQYFGKYSHDIFGGWR